MSCSAGASGFFFFLPDLLSCGYTRTKETTHFRKSVQIYQFKVFHEPSVLILLMLHSCKQSAAQKAFQWKYAMKYHMECTHQKWKFVFLNAPSIWLYLFLDSIFFPQKSFGLQRTGERRKNLEMEHFPPIR